MGKPAPKKVTYSAC